MRRLKINMEIWNNIKEIVGTTLASLFVFLDIDINVVIILGWMVAIDTFWGILKAALVSKIEFSFKILYLKFLGKLSFLFVPLTLALMAVGIGMDFKFFVEGVIKLMIVTEGISIVTNILSIKDNRPYKNGDYATKLIHFIRDYLIKFYEKIQSSFGHVKKNILEEEDKNLPNSED